MIARVCNSLNTATATSAPNVSGKASTRFMLYVELRNREVATRKVPNHRARYQHRVVRSVRSAPALPKLLRPK